MESVWLYLAELGPGAGAECPEQQRWKERLMLGVPRQLGSSINRLHGERAQPLLAGRMASEARRWGKQRAHVCTAHTVVKEENGRNPMAESKPQTQPPSSPPTGQEQRAPSLTPLISNEANTQKPSPNQKQHELLQADQDSRVLSSAPALPREEGLSLQRGRERSRRRRHADSILCSWSLLLGLTDLASIAHKRAARSICN